MSVEGMGGTDDALLAQLLDALDRQEPAPTAAVEAGKAVFALRDLDAELALLVWDSELHDPAVTVRAAATVAPVRSMTFEHDGVSLDLEAEPDGAGAFTLIGRLTTGTGLVLVLERAGGDPTPLDVDELGRFAARGVVPGRLRLRIRQPAAPAAAAPAAAAAAAAAPAAPEGYDIVTSWFTLSE